MDFNRTTTSELLALAASRGDLREQAWRVFLDRHVGLLRAVVQRAGISSDAAEDVAQEAALECWQAVRAGRYDRERGRLRSFMVGIAYNRAVDRSRRQRHAPKVGAGAEDMMSLPSSVSELERIFDEELHQKIIREALDLLANQCGFSTQTLEAFERVHVDGHPPADVARDLGLSTQVVYNATHRCLARLRELVGDLRSLYDLG